MRRDLAQAFPPLAVEKGGAVMRCDALLGPAIPPPRYSTNAPDIDQRIAESVVPEPNTGCWLWLRSLISKGYAQVSFRGRRVLVHRYQLSRRIGRELRSDEMACHKCDQRSCVNPDHLFVGSALDNSHDCIRKGRHPAHKRDHAGPGGLNADLVRSARSAAEAGVPTAQFARSVGIRRETVRDAVLRLTWKHIP